MGKDVITVGSQSGTIPYDYENIFQFPLYRYSFLLDTLPDCIVLCVNLFDSFDYIHRTVSFLEATAKGKVIALAAIPFNIKDNANNPFGISKAFRFAYVLFDNIDERMDNLQSVLEKEEIMW